MGAPLPDVTDRDEWRLWYEELSASLEHEHMDRYPTREMAEAEARRRLTAAWKAST